MLSDQRFIISRDIPAEVGFLFVVVAVAAAAFAILGYRTAGQRGETIVRATAVALCGLGLFVAGYIAYKALIVNEPFQCAGGGGGCALVEQSSYARPFWGIHLSVWGLIGYSTILAATLWKGDNARLTAFGLSVFGFVASLALRYVELWEINAACQWCWASGLLMTMLLVVNTFRLIGFYGTGGFDGEQSSDAADEDPEEKLDEPLPGPAEGETGDSPPPGTAKAAT